MCLFEPFVCLFASFLCCYVPFRCCLALVDVFCVTYVLFCTIHVLSGTHLCVFVSFMRCFVSYMCICHSVIFFFLYHLCAVFNSFLCFAAPLKCSFASCMCCFIYLCAFWTPLPSDKADIPDFHGNTLKHYRSVQEADLLTAAMCVKAVVNQVATPFMLPCVLCRHCVAPGQHTSLCTSCSIQATELCQSVESNLLAEIEVCTSSSAAWPADHWTV